MKLLYAAITLGGLGVVFGLLLAWAAKVFAVEVDERVEAVKEILPGANCGACGYAGCSNFAEGVVSGDAELSGCIPGGKEVTEEIAKLLGKEGVSAQSLVAVVFCAGDDGKAAHKFHYDGAKDCKLAHSLWGGFKECRYGCLGLGNCVVVCPFDAIKMGAAGLPIIDETRCTGCGLCREECPRDIIRTIPKGYCGHIVMCNSKDRGKAVKNACSVGCISCKACIKACEKGAITMVDNIPVIDMEICDNCAECSFKCRQGGIRSRSSMLHK